MGNSGARLTDTADVRGSTYTGSFTGGMKPNRFEETPYAVNSNSTGNSGGSNYGNYGSYYGYGR
eukprot:CAMPEP_0113866722 /NCGR_PEP_ID=MMETSP0780_2-20120614/25_1 /TAXON_ID=652834 /ORGANISM="Palpitomonas bilix" /LENGTH=63 /DNA_ID=CAMNT_0000851593 /DNA_START=180 /DNA_END=371 /DNA_ORIENTATION=+ /assembly_acc=CAM_ASM_000599